MRHELSVFRPENNKPLQVSVALPGVAIPMEQFERLHGRRMKGGEQVELERTLTVMSCNRKRVVSTDESEHWAALNK